MLKKGSRSVIDVSSARDLTELLRIYRELKKSIEPLVKPIEDELRRTMGEILYSWVTDLGSAKELQRGNLEELYKKIKGHFKT